MKWNIEKQIKAEELLQKVGSVQLWQEVTKRMEEGSFDNPDIYPGSGDVTVDLVFEPDNLLRQIGFSNVAGELPSFTIEEEATERWSADRIELERVVSHVQKRSSTKDIEDELGVEIKTLYEIQSSLATSGIFGSVNTPSLIKCVLHWINQQTIESITEYERKHIHGITE